MDLNCLLGKHQFGLPRMDTTGTLWMECLRCLHVRRTVVTLMQDPSISEARDSWRAHLIAELAEQKRWVGLPTNAATEPIRDVQHDAGERPPDQSVTITKEAA